MEANNKYSIYCKIIWLIMLVVIILSVIAEGQALVIKPELKGKGGMNIYNVFNKFKFNLTKTKHNGWEKLLLKTFRISRQ
jgi:hypothetical protein